MKILIIEDEHLAAEKLSGFVKQYNSGITILGVLESVRACLKWFEDLPGGKTGHEMPDLILSDIELLDGNVFSFFSQKKISCPIIFTTSYDEFLMKAFEVNGIAYLLKPFDFQQFEQAMKKYESLKENFSTFDEVLFQKIKQSFSENSKPSRKENFKTRFAVKTSKGIFIVNVSDIAFIRVEDGVVFCFSNHKKFPLNHSLSELEQMLDPGVFFRINRSEMVNVHFIEKLESYFNDRLSIVIKNMEERLISSASRTSALRKWIG